MMSESQVITLGWCYEMAKADRAQALRQLFKDALEQTETPSMRELFIYCFNQGRKEARSK